MEHAAVQRENAVLRCEAARLREECERLRAELSGFNGKLRLQPLLHRATASIT